MKQVVQNQRGELRVVEVPVPAARDGGLLVRTVCSVVSPGTERANVERSRRSLLAKARERPDLVKQVLTRIRREGFGATLAGVQDKLDAYIPMGYSSAGIVEAVGAGAEEFRVGDLVACGGGGYAVHAEMAWVPKQLCARVPATSEVTAEEAAFATLGAIALQGVRQAEVRVGEVVAVIGLGLLGLLTVQLLDAAGALVVASDPDPQRAALARELGAVAVAGPGEAFHQLVRGHSRERGADSVIITASTSNRGPIVDAGVVARDRARVIIVGAVPADVPRSPYFEKELDVRFSRSYGPGRYDPAYEEGGHDYPIGYVRWTEQRNLEAFLDLVARKRVRTAPLVTHRFPIANALEAYALITGGGSASVAVTLTYADAPGRRGAPAVVAGRAPAPGRVGIGLIGAGSFAQSVLLPALRAVPAADLRMVATGSGLSAQSVAERFGVAAAASDVAEVLGDPSVSAVCILTRHHLHAAQVIAALDAGKHVFVEKPLCIQAPELAEIEAALARATAREGGPPVLLVGFNRRFAPQVRRLREQLAGRQGPIHVRYRVNAGAVPATSWVHDPAVGGGRWVGEGCHFVDLVHALVGVAPARVSAVAGRRDELSALFAYQDGSTAVVDYLSSGHPGVPKERIEVTGEGSQFVLDDYTTLAWQTPAGTGRDELRAQDKGHRAEMQAFIEGIQRGVAPVAPEALLATMRSTFTALHSAATGTTVELGGA